MISRRKVSQYLALGKSLATNTMKETLESGKKYLDTLQRNSLPAPSASKRTKKEALVVESEDEKPEDKEIHLTRK
jgi:hypothetical protein